MTRCMNQVASFLRQHLPFEHCRSSQKCLQGCMSAFSNYTAKLALLDDLLAPGDTIADAVDPVIFEKYRISCDVVEERASCVQRFWTQLFGLKCPVISSSAEYRVHRSLKDFRCRETSYICQSGGCNGRKVLVPAV